jgi:hypothetical protein
LKFKGRDAQSVRGLFLFFIRFFCAVTHHLK